VWSTLVLLGWAAGVFVLFRRLSPRRAVLIAYLSGVLFLPELRDPTNWRFAPNPLSAPLLKVTKANVIGLTLLLATLACDGRRWRSFRLRWFDLPMLVWCLCPLASAMTNEAPPDPAVSWWQDGLAQMREQCYAWGVPYLLGRLYFNTLESFRELTIAAVLSCLVYLPFCVIEIPVGPRLHEVLYGFKQHDPQQAERGSLWRPVCFMEHGLAVALWLHCGALIAFALWSSGSWNRQWLSRGRPPLKVAWIVLSLAAVAVMTGSKGALVLCLGGAAVFCLTRWVRLRVLVVLLLLAAPLYIGGRLLTARQPTGWLVVDYYSDEAEEAEQKALGKPLLGYGRTSTREVLTEMGRLFGDDRTQSFEFRVKNEDKLMEKALERPWFGAGGWGRARIRDNPALVPDGEEGRERTVPDGLWILTLGDRGFVGLAALYAAMLLPALRFVYHHRPWVWSRPAFVPVAAAAIVVVLYMIDNVSNAMVNPLYVLLAGGLATLCGPSGPIPVGPEPVAAAARLPGVYQPRGLLRRRLPSSSS
jgi:hypothetical protein